VKDGEDQSIKSGVGVLVLGLESTCDETAAAVVRDGREILSNVVTSQIDLHKPFGGVVPEIACRRHLELIAPVIREALSEALVTLDEIDLIAVAQGPGLVGALLVGLNAAKGLAIGANKPLIGINHVEAHLYAAIMANPDVQFPALGVVLSGGHTALLKVHAVGHYELISNTVDDAIGEAFDKVASVLDLPYPGGPEIEKLAKQGDPHRYPFRAGRVKGKPLHFSFSGLKTNVLYVVKGQGNTRKDPTLLSDQEKADVAASFQEAAFHDIVKKATLAAKGCRSILLGGGVVNNRRLREMFKPDLPVLWPDPALTLDNAAMIAGLAYHRLSLDGPSPLTLAAKPRYQLLTRVAT
jgi:tRNA N6-adenosine threonylcarbamoyltransferase